VREHCLREFHRSVDGERIASFDALEDSHRERPEVVRRWYRNDPAVLSFLGENRDSPTLS